MLYYIISDLSKEKKHFEFILNGIVLSIFVGAAATIVIASGLWKAGGVIVNNTIYGLYQYTNTTAAILGAGIFLCFGLLLESKRPFMAVCYQIALVSMLSVFILTISRGAYLILAIMGLVYFLIVGLTQKLQLLMNGIISLISAGLLVFSYYKYHTGAVILMYFLIAAVLASILQYLYFTKIKTKVLGISNVYGKYVYIAVIAVVAIISFVMLFKEPVNFAVDTNSSKSRVVDNLAADTEYILRYEAAASSQDADNYGVSISSQNSRYEYVELAKDTGRTGAESTAKELKFKTNQDTQVIYIYFQNIAQKDNITSFKNVQIYDAAGNLVDSLDQFKFIPRQIAERIENFSLKTGYNDARFIYASDGFKIFKDYPLFGAGAGGWKNLYRGYQSYPYNTTETHNFYIQYAIEVGILGLLGLVLVFILVAKGFISAAFKNKDHLSISVYMGLFMLLIHASMDIDLSLAAPAYLLWAIIGCISVSASGKRIESKHRGYIFAGIIIITAFLIFNNASTYAGMHYGNRAAKEISELQKSKDFKNLEQAEKYLKKAIELDKLNSAYRADYAQLLNSRAKSMGDTRIWVEVEKNIKEIQRYEPHNYDYLGVIVNILLQNSKFKEAADLVDKAIADQPLSISMYELKIDANYAVADMYFKNNNKADSIYFLDNMIEVEQELEEAQGRSTKKIEVPSKITQMIKLARNWKSHAEKSIK